MLISSYIFSDSEFCSVNFSSMYENSELKVFKNIKYLGEMSDPAIYWEQMYTRLLNVVDNHC